MKSRTADATSITSHAGRDAAAAYRLLVLSVVFAVLAFGVGAAWDRAWHASHPFEDFWSPPHLFIYTMNAVATLLLARIAFTPALRAQFGEPIRVPLLRFAVAASLVFAGGGFTIIALAGAFDSLWHGAFGLDETAWSFPHSMLGSGIALSLMGFASARYALAERKPLARWAPALIAWIVLGTLTGVFLGPLDNDHTLANVRAVASLPVLATEPDFQRTVRIYETWDLTRSHPIFVPLSAFVVGIGLALARRLTGRTWVFIAVAAAVTLMQMSSARDTARFFALDADPRTWLPIPFVVPALAVAVLAPRAGDRVAWGVAGLLHAIVVAVFWGATPIGVVAAAPLMAAGAPLGEALERLVRAPGAAVIRVVPLIGVGLPALTGVVDLFLRARTP